MFSFFGASPAACRSGRGKASDLQKSEQRMDDQAPRLHAGVGEVKTQIFLKTHGCPHMLLSLWLLCEMYAFCLCVGPFWNSWKSCFWLGKCYFLQFQKITNNPAYWTFSRFLLRVKNVEFCLCFGLIDSLWICWNFDEIACFRVAGMCRCRRRL